MTVETQKTVETEAKVLKIFCKVRDEFNCIIKDKDDYTIKEYEGYVPNFMPGEHYGDYLILDIDIDTGQVTNWGKIDKNDLEEFINAKED